MLGQILTTEAAQRMQERLDQSELNRQARHATAHRRAKARLRRSLTRSVLDGLTCTEIAQEAAIFGTAGSPQQDARQAG